MRTRWTALWAAAALAVLAGCQSATQTNLAEYESLVARRRNPAPSATPMAVRAAQEKAEAEARAAEARAREAEARARKAEAEAASAKEKAVAAERAAARRAQEKAQAEKKAEAERNAAEARKAQEAAGKEASKQAAKEAQRRAAEEQKAAERRAAEEREAREAAERDAAAAVEVVAPPQATAPAAPSGRSDTTLGGNTAYVLAVGDAVQIVLRGIPGGGEAIEDIIDEGGYVTLPFIDEVKAAGCTATQLEKAIRDTYRERRIYKDINVQVMVPTRFYYMQGEIRGPGRVQLVSAVRLSQAIAANGGGTEFWNGKVVVKRNDGRIVNVKNARRLERTPEEDILLEPGDIVELKRGWL